MKIIDKTHNKSDTMFSPGAVIKVFDEELRGYCYYFVAKLFAPHSARLYNLATGNPFSACSFPLINGSFTIHDMKDYIEDDCTSFKFIGVVDADLVIKEVK